MWTWTREQLKTRAKNRMKAGYWKTVLVSLVVSFFAGGGYLYVLTDSLYTDIFSLLEYVSNSAGTSSTAAAGVASFKLGEGVAFYVLVVITSAIFLVLLWGIMIAMNTLLINPLAVGCSRFYVKNLNTPALVREVAYGFDHNYKNIVETLFFRDMYVFFWSLLFIVPGIVKAYGYRMVPYIMAENPGMPRQQALALSQEMMNGQKWDAFVLDISFIGWEILSLMTAGLLGIFYLKPYRNMTNAALYENLKYMMNCRRMNMEMQMRQQQ